MVDYDFSNLPELIRKKNFYKKIKAGDLSNAFMKALIEKHPLAQSYDSETGELVLSAHDTRNNPSHLSTWKDATNYRGFEKMLIIDGRGATLENAEADYLEHFRKSAKDNGGVVVLAREKNAWNVYRPYPKRPDLKHEGFIKRKDVLRFVCLEGKETWDQEWAFTPVT